MSRIILAAATLAVVTCGALAQDRSIDQAAAAIVAAKIGDLRDGFDFNEMPEFVSPVDWNRAAWGAVLDPRPVAAVAISPLRTPHGI